MATLLANMSANKENRSDDGLSEFFVAFKFIKDKDEFERGYRMLLIDRVVSNKSVY